MAINIQMNKREMVHFLHLGRLSFGFHNPNHAAAFACALLPHDSPRTGIRGNPCPSVDDSKCVTMTCAFDGTKSRRRYTAAALTAFGEPLPAAATSPNSNIRQFDHSIISSPFFTGKPEVEGLGRVFLYRNYRSDLAKWQTADPTDYCDGFNQFSYCRNSPTMAFDTYSLWTVQLGIYGFAGASTGGTISLGIALGFSWRDGFTCGFYYNGGVGSEVGAGGSAGIVVQISNSRNVAELAGQAISVGVSGGEVVVFGFETVIPLNIGETGYWGFDFSVGVGGGTPMEGHAIYNYTGFFKVYE